MKLLLFFTLLLSSSNTLFAQENNNSNPNLQTASETKHRFAKGVFNSKKYVKANYGIFSGRIKLVESTIEQFGDTTFTINTFKFRDKFITLLDVNSKLEKLFEKGIFNPDVIFGKTTVKKSSAEIKKLSQTEKIIFNYTRNDTITIAYLQQLEKLNPNPKTKRFIFWVWRIGVANPTEYYIEFYNEKATKETELDEFIENSKMSFFYKGTIII